MTHARARGSNDLIWKNVLQTMTLMSPDEYERLQALNAWTGRSDLVGLRHNRQMLGLNRDSAECSGSSVGLQSWPTSPRSHQLGRARPCQASGSHKR
jgi:hypothetical protein